MGAHQSLLLRMIDQELAHLDEHVGWAVDRTQAAEAAIEHPGERAFGDCAMHELGRQHSLLGQEGADARHGEESLRVEPQSVRFPRP